MKLASFDLEIAKEFPEGTDDWQKYAPLGITCAAAALSDSEQIRYWYREGPQLTRQDCQAIVRGLQQLTREGYQILTWNGCSFDFQVLARESGMYEECGVLAMNHIDMMLLVTFQKGWYLGLQKALIGAGLEGKRKVVTLSDGTMVTDMDGSKAPELWTAGEYEAVLSYLEEDVLQPLWLAEAIQRDKVIRWISNSGRPNFVRVERLLTVRECFAYPEPDTSWMTDPPDRSDFVKWIPYYQQFIKKPAGNGWYRLTPQVVQGHSVVTPVEVIFDLDSCPTCGAAIEFIDREAVPITKICANGHEFDPDEEIRKRYVNYHEIVRAIESEGLPGERKSNVPAYQGKSVELCPVCGTELEFLTVEDIPVLKTCRHGHDVETDEEIKARLAEYVGLYWVQEIAQKGKDDERKAAEENEVYSTSEALVPPRSSSSNQLAEEKRKPAPIIHRRSLLERVVSAIEGFLFG